MNEISFFISCLVAVALGAVCYTYRFNLKAAWDYLNNDDEGKDVRTGIVLFMGIGILIVLMSGCSDTRYMTKGEIFLGLDNTFKQSPQCRVTSGTYSNDRLTSNGGFTLTLAETGDTELNAKYTHHSCAFNPDRNSYDAIGLEVTKPIWSR